MRKPIAVIRGGGDLATGTINRLFRAGFQVYVLEIERPTVIRLEVSAATAIYNNTIDIEGVSYVYCRDVSQAEEAVDSGRIPVLIDPHMESVGLINPDLVVDAILAKKNLGLTSALAKHVVALGPGFTAGMDCHAVIETSRGHNLGRIIYKGKAKDNTGIPGNISGYTEERVIRSPQKGHIKILKGIGDPVNAGETIGYVGSEPVISRIDGVIRGLIHTSVDLESGMKIGDVDPRGDKEFCYSISDKARALGGSVLEAYLNLSGGILIP